MWGADRTKLHKVRIYLSCGAHRESHHRLVNKVKPVAKYANFWRENEKVCSVCGSHDHMCLDCKILDDDQHQLGRAKNYAVPADPKTVSAQRAGRYFFWRNFGKEYRPENRTRVTEPKPPRNPAQAWGSTHEWCCQLYAQLQAKQHFSTEVTAINNFSTMVQNLRNPDHAWWNALDTPVEQRAKDQLADTETSSLREFFMETALERYC